MKSAFSERGMLISERWWPLASSAVLITVIGAALQFAISDGFVSPFVIAPPVEILKSIPKLFTEENLIELFMLTLGVTFSATAIAALLAIPAGWFLFRYRDFGKAYESWLGALFSAPIILLYPLFLVVMGRGLPAVIAMSVVVGITPIILNTFNGLRGVPKVLVNVARSYGMSESDIFRKVLFPAALPSIFTGIRLALIYTMINVVAMEFLISIGGLGFLVGDLYDRYELPEMYAAVLFVILASILFFSAINRLEQWLRQR